MDKTITQVEKGNRRYSQKEVEKAMQMMSFKVLLPIVMTHYRILARSAMHLHSLNKRTP
jgi:hypothetical protein